jgi:phospholipid/cholesterol/gamma-HCH transport system permease protein
MTPAEWSWSENGTELSLTGKWTARGISRLKAIQAPEAVSIGQLQVNAAEVDGLDCAGALQLVKFCKSIGVAIQQVSWQGLNDSQKTLLDMVSDEWEPAKPCLEEKPHFVTEVGESAVEKGKELQRLVRFFGHVVMVFLSMFTGKNRFQWQLFAKNIEDTGFRAMGIAGLLNFLIGLVLAYQMIFMLSTYGAAIYTVELTGIITFREFGPIITAIVVAGRTATAFTAEIGTMKVREEVDALSAFGIEPVERLVIPKLCGLLVAMPLLIVLADIAGVFGSMLMAKLEGGITFGEFINRFQNEVPVLQLWVGLVKAPLFAFAIALVGTYQGFSASQSAQSVGRKTTHAAVQAIFLVIVIDAIYSVILSLYGV